MMIAVRVTDVGQLEDVVARLRRALEELEVGVDDAHEVLAELTAAGEDLDDFTNRLRVVLGG